MFFAGCVIGALMGGVAGTLISCLVMAGYNADVSMIKIEPEVTKDEQEVIPVGQCIRFTDSMDHALFNIPDGDCIVLTYKCGYHQKCLCFYIDDTHARINGQCWSIQAFARQLEARDITCAPAEIYGRPVYEGQVAR